MWGTHILNCAHWIKYETNSTCPIVKNHVSFSGDFNNHNVKTNVNSFYEWSDVTTIWSKCAEQRFNVSSNFARLIAIVAIHRVHTLTHTHTFKCTSYIHWTALSENQSKNRQSFICQAMAYIEIETATNHTEMVLIPHIFLFRLNKSTGNDSLYGWRSLTKISTWI